MIIPLTSPTVELTTGERRLLVNALEGRDLSGCDPRVLAELIGRIKP